MSGKKMKIISNQVRCKKCGDTPYSSNRHDFRYCECKSIAVDGGNEYLKRVGDFRVMEEMSIEIPSDAEVAIREAVKWGHDNNRNDLGISYAVLRALRDNGVKMVSEPEDDSQDIALKACARLLKALADEGYMPGDEISDLITGATRALQFCGYHPELTE